MEPLGLMISRSDNMRKTIFLTLAGLLLLSYPIKSYAIPGTYPFGGNVLAYTYCTCSANFLVSVGYPRPGVFIYQPTIPGFPAGTDLRAFWSVLVPGTYVVGLAEDVPMTCMEYVGTGCAPIGAGPMMLLVGTSYPL